MKDKIMKDKIICLVGLSGSGKTTIARILDKAFKYNVIQSYTTRPPRSENEYGHTFATEQEYEDTLKPDIVAYTNYNGYHYWTLKSQYQNKGNSIFVVDPRGVKLLKENVKDAEIIVAMIHTDRSIRFSRIAEEEKLTSAQIPLLNKRLDRELDQYGLVECDFALLNNEGSDKTAELLHLFLNELNNV